MLAVFNRTRDVRATRKKTNSIMDKPNSGNVPEKRRDSLFRAVASFQGTSKFSVELESQYGARKPAVVLDIGECHIKCGFAGEPCPRFIAKSPLHDFLYRDGKQRQYSSQEWSDFCGELMDDVFFKYLRVRPKERNVLVVENSLAPSQLRIGIGNTLLRHMQILSLKFISSAPLALVPTGSTTGVNLCIGYSECRVTPVMDGGHICGSGRIANFGMKSIHGDLAAMLKKENPNQLVSRGDIMNLTSKYGFVKLDANDSHFKDDQHLLLGTSKLKCPTDAISNLIEKYMFSSDPDKNVVFLLLDSILRCPIDTRRAVVQNIVMTGGGASLQNIMPRLSSEILKVIGTLPKYQQLSGIVSQMNIGIASSITPNCGEWLGGSIIGKAVVPFPGVSRNEYIEYSGPPDFFDDMKIN